MLRSVVRARAAPTGHRGGCGLTEGLVNLCPPVMYQVVDARTVAEEVCFWDKSLRIKNKTHIQTDDSALIT